MEIYEGIRIHLANDPTIGSMVGNKIRPLRADPDDQAPYVVYQRIVTTEEHSHSGATGIQRPRFQIACIGSNYVQARQLASAVRSRINGFAGQMGGIGGIQVGFAKVDNEVEDFEFDTDLVRVLVDVTISHH